MFGSLDQLQSQYQSQIDTLNRMRMAQSDVLDEIKKELESLGKDELQLLYESPEWTGAKAVYESGFLQFLSDKFAAEYVSTGTGREAATSLLSSLRDSKTRITAQVKSRSEKINKILELLDSDPEMKKRYNELTMGGKKGGKQ